MDNFKAVLLERTVLITTRIRFPLALIIVFIIVVVAPRTCFGSNEFSKPAKILEVEYEDLPKLWEFTEKLFKRLSCVESSLQDNKQISACADAPGSLIENMEFENRIRKPERDISDQINTNNEELNSLKSIVQKLTDDVAEMQKEHKEFQRNVKNLEEKLNKHSQSMKKKNAKVSRKLFQHGKTLHGLNASIELLNINQSSLNVSVENHGTTLSSLNVSVENNGGTLHSLNVNVENIRSTLKDLNASVETHGSTLNSLNASVENIRTTVSSLNVSVENIRTTVSSLNVSVENIRSTLSILRASVETHGSTLSSLNVSVENRVTATEHDLLGQINANNKEMEALKDEVRKLNSSLEAHVKTLEVKLGEQSQLAEKKNAEVVKQIYYQKEALNELNVSLENHGCSLNKHHLSVENLSSSFDGLRLFVEKLNSTLISLNVSVENRVDATERDLSCQINTNHKEIEALKDDVLKLNTKLATNVTKLEDKLDEQSQFAENRNAQLMKQISQHNETLNALNVSITNLGSTLSGLNVSVASLGSTLSGLNVSVETLGCNISGLNASLDILHSNMKHLTENMTGISIETIVLDKKTEEMKENIFDKVSLTSVIMINTTLLVVVIIYLVANRKHATRHPSGNVYGYQTKVKPNPAPYSTAGRILSHVGEFPRLERKLCVISFYEETRPLHMNITQSVTQELNMEVVEFTIRRHDHILELPRVSLYFLFVDFNERNVILEDPTLGLGDLRLTTVQAIQKMGGLIIVFYVRDPNSRQLNPTKLYNEHLASVTRQQELSDLNRRSCFISAYDQLTDHQKAHLRHTVVQELNVR